MKYNTIFLRILVILLVIMLGYLGIQSYQSWQLKSQGSIPTKKNLSVPFTSQAPDANWSEPWQNACEETSVIMATNFYKDKKITPDQAKQQILEVFSVKNREFGQSADESMERIVEIINAADLGWTATVIINPELNAIKEEIAANRPVIAPVDARLLLGSQYESGIIDYHVVVISGYDDKTEEFIVQDPGTKSGKNNRYTYENFYQAINDYLPQATPSGRKAVLFTKPTD